MCLTLRCGAGVQQGPDAAMPAHRCVPMRRPVWPPAHGGVSALSALAAEDRARYVNDARPVAWSSSAEPAGDDCADRAADDEFGLVGEVQLRAVVVEDEHAGPVLTEDR